MDDVEVKKLNLVLALGSNHLRIASDIQLGNSFTVELDINTSTAVDANSKTSESLNMTNFVSLVFAVLKNKSPPANGTSFFTGVRHPVRNSDRVAAEKNTVIRFICSE